MIIPSPLDISMDCTKLYETTSITKTTAMTTPIRYHNLEEMIQLTFFLEQTKKA